MKLRLFGGLEVLDASGRPIEVSARKARALLAYLAAAPARRHGREVLAALLWGDISTDEQARRSLRQALSVLRKVLPTGGLETARDEVGLAEEVQADVRAFGSAVNEGDREALRRAVVLYRGDFLEGFSARADGFDEWAGHQRTRLRERAVEAMERLGRLERDVGQLEAAITLAMRVVALEPLRESAHRDLMELYVAVGAPGRALKQYDACQKLLAEELGIAPSVATTALAARIRTAGGGGGKVALQVPERPPEPMKAAQRAGGPALRQVVVVHVTTAWDDADRRHEAREAARETLARHGGRVWRDFADVVAAVFGAGRTRGSTVEQAVHAAVALRGRLSAQDLAVRIGVASGQALVEEVAEGLRVQGEVVSLAASLHEVGALVVSTAVRAELGERAEVWERSPVRGAAAWELTALREEAPKRSVLLGRDFELAQLVASLAPCIATERGRSHLVRGEPGIGKTLLVACFCDEAKKAGFEVHRQRMLDFGGGTDGDPLHDLARSLLLAPAGGDVEAALATALNEGELVTSDLGFVRQMVALSGPRATEVDAGPAETARRHSEIVVKLLRARCRHRPQLVWIEDIHWASPATLEQLTHLMTEVARCRALLVLTTRIVGEPDDDEWRRAVKGRAVSTVDLAPLPDSVARELLEKLAKRRGATAVDAPRILERAGGNPLFLEQLSWADTADAVPGSIQALVQQRVDALDERSRSLLESASVLGQRLDEGAVARLMGTSEVDLAELIDHGLLRTEADGVMFGHALVRDAVYASLTDERRRALHLAAAGHYGDRNAWLRADHLERAGDDSAAAAYLEAADGQRHRGATGRSLALSERGIALATRDVDLERLCLLRGEILRELGRADEALAAFDAARRHGTSDEQRARAWLGTAGVLRLLDRQEQALEALAVAQSLLEADETPELVAHVHFMRGNVLFPSGDAEACLREHQRALELAEQARSSLAEAQALSGMADAHYLAERMRSATQLFERCETLAAREGFSSLERTSRGMRLFIQVLFLRVREATDACLAEAELAEKVGALRAVAFLRTGACLALGYLGDWERMACEAEAVAELTGRIGARRFEALSLAYLATARFHLGLQHRPELERALELSMSSGPTFSGGIVHAATLATTTEPAALRRELRRGLAALDAGALAHGRIVFLCQAITSAIRLRDADETRRLADMLARSPEPCELVTLFVDLGRAAADARSDDREAEARLAEIVTRAAEAGLKPIAELMSTAVPPG